MLNITEIRIKLVPGHRDKLRAFASLTLDGALVIRDIKIIDGGDRLFVAMPSRKLCDRCSHCGGKNYVRSRFCNDCGVRLGRDRADIDERGRPRLYSDIAHPIHPRARDQFQTAILAAFEKEIDLSSREGYVATTFEDMDYEVWGETGGG